MIERAPATLLLSGFALLVLLSAPCGAKAAPADGELIASCRGVAAATEPARRVWLDRDLFAYEMHRAVGASNDEMRIYRANLADTCARVAYNNRLRRVRNVGGAPTWRPTS